MCRCRESTLVSVCPLVQALNHYSVERYLNRLEYRLFVWVLRQMLKWTMMSIAHRLTKQLPQQSMKRNVTVSKRVLGSKLILYIDRC